LVAPIGSPPPLSFYAKSGPDRRIRSIIAVIVGVSSKQELKDRLMAAMDFFNRDPVVHTWTYKLDKAA
jgi:hypothetical protein